MNPPKILSGEKWNRKTLWRLVWPLIIEQLLAVTIGMADTAMVTAVGETAVSGVALVDSINILLITAFSALATGGAVVASQYLGRQDAKSACLAARQLVYSITAMSVLIMVFVLVLRRPILQLLFGHIEPAVMQSADTYFWLSAISYPFLALYNAGAALFRSMGNSRVGMFTALLVNILNIGGNSLLIFGFGWGVAGAATSTLISRLVAGLVMIRLLLPARPGGISLAGLFKPSLNRGMMRSILKIGLPNGLENSMFQIGKLLVSRLISTFGTAAIAGNAIANIFGSIGYLPGQAIGLALLTVVGQCVGAGDYAAARRNTKKLMRVAVIVLVVLNILTLLIMRPAIGLLHLSEEAARTAINCLSLACTAGTIFWAQSFTLPSALRAAGDARFTMLVSMFSMWVFRIGFSFLFANFFGLGVFGVWMAMVADWIVRSIIFNIRWRGKRWEGKKVI